MNDVCIIRQFCSVIEVNSIYLDNQTKWSIIEVICAVMEIRLSKFGYRGKLTLITEQSVRLSKFDFNLVIEVNLP